MAGERPATLRSIQRLAPGSPAACRTSAVVHHKTSPTRGLRSPRPFAHSPVRLAPGSPIGGFAPLHCDAVPAPTVRNRCAPVVLVSAHRVHRPFHCPSSSIPPFCAPPPSLFAP